MQRMRVIGQALQPTIVGITFSTIAVRTPRDVQAKTDANGEAVIKLADYAWTTLLEVNPQGRGYDALFVLNKQAIRKGGVIEDQYRSDKHPRLRLELRPVKRPNKTD